MSEHEYHNIEVVDWPTKPKWKELVEQSLPCSLKYFTELEAENAKLREENAQQQAEIGRAHELNVKIRELVMRTKDAETIKRMEKLVRVATTEPPLEETP